MKARYWPCFSVKREVAEALDMYGSRFDQKLIEGATMNVRYRVTLETSRRRSVRLVAIIAVKTRAKASVLALQVAWLTPP